MTSENHGEQISLALVAKHEFVGISGLPSNLADHLTQHMHYVEIPGVMRPRYSSAYALGIAAMHMLPSGAPFRERHIVSVLSDYARTPSAHNAIMQTEDTIAQALSDTGPGGLIPTARAAAMIGITRRAMQDWPNNGVALEPIPDAPRRGTLGIKPATLVRLLEWHRPPDCAGLVSGWDELRKQYLESAA